MPLTYTYDLTTLIGKTRLSAADTNVGNPSRCVWSDEELQVFLDRIGGNPELAAARALRAAAADAAKVAVITKIGNLGNDETHLRAELELMALALERAAIVTPVVDAPDQVFSTDSGAGTQVGTMHVW